MDEKQAEYLFSSLVNSGYAIIEDLAPRESLDDFAFYFKHQDLFFHSARVGASPHLDKTIRGDVICWIEPSDSAAFKGRKNLATEPAPTCNKILEFLTTLQKGFNENLFCGLKRFESHLALYESGAAYQMHTDNPQGKNHRQITFICYLNPSWKLEDGGELEIYSSTGVLLEKVNPTFGKWVFFLSERFPHRVLASHQPRKSFTGWFRTDNESL